ncbi:MAG TPA: hypothetical protein VGP72_27030 [Planctomycetota bacterium]|jgi:hypothetical protein
MDARELAKLVQDFSVLGKALDSFFGSMSNNSNGFITQPDSLLVDYCNKAADYCQVLSTPNLQQAEQLLIAALKYSFERYGPFGYFFNGDMLHKLGWTEMVLGNHSKAEEILKFGLEFYRNRGNQFSEAGRRKCELTIYATLGGCLLTSQRWRERWCEICALLDGNPYAHADWPNVRARVQAGQNPW